MHQREPLEEKPYSLPRTVARPRLFLSNHSLIDNLPYWANLSFSPVGIYALRAWQGATPAIPRFFQQYPERFRGSDVIWHIVGSHKDNAHRAAPNHFHESIKQFNQDTAGYEGSKEERTALFDELQGLMFDTATTLDRLSGSTTMILRSPGTTVPGSPIQPNYLKCHVYLPPYFVLEHPELHDTLSDLVQTYIENVGCTTALDWTSKAKVHLGYGLTQRGVARENAASFGIPAPKPGTSHYLFLGRPSRNQAPTNGNMSADPPFSSQNSYDFDGDVTENEATICNLQEKLYLAEVREASLKSQLEIALKENAALEAQLATTESLIIGRSTQDIFPLSQTTQTRAATPLRNVMSPGKHRVNTPSKNSLLASPVTIRKTRERVPESPRPFEREHSSPFPRPPSPGPSCVDDPSSDSDLGGSLVTRLLSVNRLCHLENSIKVILKFAPQDKQHAALVALGVEAEVARVLCGVSGVVSFPDPLELDDF